VFPDFMQMQERPFLPKGLSSSPFDSEGVVTRDRDVVKDGVVQGYFLVELQRPQAEDAEHRQRRRQSQPDRPQSTGEDFAGLLKKMGTGLLVTELLGHGLNMVTGDYSRGAAGFWVENGVIAYPVEEITIAGNLKDMFRGIVAIGSDIEVRGSRQVGSILIDNMTVAGIERKPLPAWLSPFSKGGILVQGRVLSAFARLLPIARGIDRLNDTVGRAVIWLVPPWC
jgi:PmbA protein